MSALRAPKRTTTWSGGHEGLRAVPAHFAASGQALKALFDSLRAGELELARLCLLMSRHSSTAASWGNSWRGGGTTQPIANCERRRPECGAVQAWSAVKNNMLERVANKNKPQACDPWRRRKLGALPLWGALDDFFSVSAAASVLVVFALVYAEVRSPAAWSTRSASQWSALPNYPQAFTHLSLINAPRAVDQVTERRRDFCPDLRGGRRCWSGGHGAPPQPTANAAGRLMARYSVASANAIGISLVGPKNEIIRTMSSTAPIVASARHQLGGTHRPAAASAASRNIKPAVTAT
jgi:hypothetical protein